jgi:hypothetical protein
MQLGVRRMRIVKVLLIWVGVRCLNCRLKLGVAFINWVFLVCPKMRAA